MHSSPLADNFMGDFPRSNGKPEHLALGGSCLAKRWMTISWGVKSQTFIFS